MNNDLFQKVKKHAEKVATKYKVEPRNVTTAQFWSVPSKIKEWEVRKCGGFLNVREILFPTPTTKRVNQVQPVAKQKTFRYKAPKLTTFSVHELNIKEAFKSAGLGKDDVLKVIVQPDTHVPEHDKNAINVFCQFLADYKPHALINLGDFMEMGSVSHWKDHSSQARRLVPEIQTAKKLLKEIETAAGPQCVIKRFLVGNHEDWLNQYLNERIPEVMDEVEKLDIDLTIQGLLKLKEFGYRVIPLNEVFKLGNAHFIHGYYTGSAHAKKHLDTFGVNIYYGHLHDTQSYSGVSVGGIHEAASLGCLRTLNAPFLKGKPNNWTHSLGIFEFRYDGTYTKYIPTIIDGVLSYNGKTYKAK